MKRLTLFASILISVALHAQEQTKQGAYSLGGSIFYSSATIKSPDSDIDQTIYSISPKCSYFFVDQFEMSFAVSYISTKFKSIQNISYYYPGYSYSSNYEFKTTDLSVGLGFAYYLPFGKISPFVGAGGQLSWSKADMTSHSDTFSPPVSNYFFTGGLEIFISQAASIEPAVMYTKVRLDENNTQNIIMVGVGVRYFIL